MRLSTNDYYDFYIKGSSLFVSYDDGDNVVEYNIKSDKEPLSKMELNDIRNRWITISLSHPDTYKD